MFCTTLRRRPSTTSLIPILLSSAPNGLNLKESHLTTHDIAIPLHPPPPPAAPVPPRATGVPAAEVSFAPASSLRTLLLLVLTPSSVLSEGRLPVTLKRVQHFASLAGGVHSVIVFLLETGSGLGLSSASTATAGSGVASGAGAGAACTSAINGSAVRSGSTATTTAEGDGMQAYTTLLHALHLSPGGSTPSIPASLSRSSNTDGSRVAALPASPSILAVPIIPLPTPSALPAVVSAYISALTSALTSAAKPAISYPPPIAPASLLAYTSLNLPLPQEAVIGLSDAFGGMGEVVDWALGRRRGVVGEGKGRMDVRAGAETGFGEGGEGGELDGMELMDEVEEEEKRRLDRAVERVLGVEGARGVREFWEGEWVVE